MSRMLLNSISECFVIGGCTSSAALSNHDAGRTAAAVPTGSNAQLRKFDIPAEDAPAALRDWSEQGRMQVLFDSSALHGRQTQAVKGTLSPPEALQAMLQGTGLNFSALNERTIAVSPDR